MRKQYVFITLLLCLIVGIIYSKSVRPEKTYFPDCDFTVSISSSGSDSICLGSAVGLSASVSDPVPPPYTYSWLPTAGLSNPSIADPVATPTVSTNYTITVTDFNGCTATASVAIVVGQAPVINADTLLEQYLLNEPLTATGGTPPYTYNFSPAVSTSSLVTILTSTVTTTYTITVTGANGCSSVYNASYVPLLGIQQGACKTIFISEYIQDTANHDDGIEVYNPTSSSINLANYYLAGTTNGSLYSTPFFIALHGTIAAHKTFLIANTHADTALTNHAGMLSDSLTFAGKDIVSLLNIKIVGSAVQCTALDMVGAISPLPTDSGWAVGSGSTKNHTLARQTSVVQGDMNWSSCELEWNVYPRATFSYIGYYQNVCTPTDPDLDLFLTNPTTNCGPPSYATFTVLAASDPSTVFNNCTIDIAYGGGEFAGDNFSNGGILVSPGADFQYNPGHNDYYISDSSTAPGDSVMEIQFGAVTDSSPNGTPLHSYGDILLYVRLRIQNSCAPGNISFTNTSITSPLSSFAFIDSTYSYTKTDTTGYTTCCCYEYSYPCDYQDSCSCYTNTCYEWVCDTTWTTQPEDIYTYSSIDSAYTATVYSGGVSSTGCPMFINWNYTNPINAGTNAKSVSPIRDIPDNSSILIIPGYGFGNKKDSIRVSNANAYGLCTLDSVDILSWTENLIKVKMPDIIFNNLRATPGTGPFTVYNACGDSASKPLQISYNIINSYDGQEKLRPDIIMKSDTASITFRCDTSVSNNPGAYACVKKAIRAWNCATGINWRLGPNDTLEVSNPDGISNIYFNSTQFGDTGLVMGTTPWYQICENLTDSVDFRDEADIEIKRNYYLAYGRTWSYDTTTNILPNTVIPFYDVILHELGHAHGLNHINDLNSIMYWITRAGYYRLGIDSGGTYPGPASLLGGWDMVNTSAAYSNSCSYTKLVPGSITCKDPTAAVTDISDNPSNLNLYPNPVNSGELNISFHINTDSYLQFKIIDYLGREIIILNEGNKPSGEYVEHVNINSLTSGVYLLMANINGQCQTIKFIKI